ncbi:hypothetical protein CALCODRAFT_423590, partial [Calocera cornea HHB12733]
APVWKYYRDQTDSWDERLLEKWDKSIDVFLLFTALFSAVVSAFLVDTMSALQPDLQQTTVDVLMHLSTQLATAGNLTAPYQLDTSWRAPTSAVWVASLWSLAIVMSLITSVFAMLAKTWITVYKDAVKDMGPEDVPRRYLHSAALEKWKMAHFVDALPLCIHVAVGLFLIGLIPYTWN